MRDKITEKDQALAFPNAQQDKWTDRPGWELMQVLRGIRRRVAPYGTQRDRVLSRGLHRFRRAPNTDLSPSPPESVIEGILDSPAPDSSCHGALSVAGWAVSPRGAIEHIRILLEGQLIGEASYGWIRPDVVATHPHISKAACGYAGNFVINPRRTGVGPANVIVQINDAVGNMLEYNRSIVIVEPPSGLYSQSHPEVEIDVEDLMTRIDQVIAESQLEEADHWKRPSDEVMELLDVDPSDAAVGLFAPTMNSKGQDAQEVPKYDLICQVTGSPNREGFWKSGAQSVRNINAALSVIGTSLQDYHRVLDFGCGCGRILLHLTDVARDMELYGVDVDAEAIAWAQRHIPCARVSVNRPLPPLDFPSESFDLIFSHSVLTHLDEEYQDAWLAELRRVSRPEGIVLLTVHGDYPFQTLLAKLRSKGKDAARLLKTLHQKGILFYDQDVWKGGPFPEYYHSTFHMPWYVFQHWSTFFDVKGYLVRGALDYEDIVVLQRKQDDNKSAGAIQPIGNSLALPFAFRPNTLDQAIFNAVYRENEYRLPTRFASEDIIIDLGAHIGSFCYAVLTRGANHVYGYEASRENWELAKRALRTFGRRVQLHPQAVWRSDREGDTLFLSPYDMAGSITNTGAVTVWNEQTGTEKLDVVSLDEIINQVTDHGQKRVRLIKVDCEGSEYPILYTAHTLHLVDGLCGEYHNLDRLIKAIPERIRVEGFEAYNGKGLGDYLQRLGFTVELAPYDDHIGFFFAHRNQVKAVR